MKGGTRKKMIIKDVTDDSLIKIVKTLLGKNGDAKKNGELSIVNYKNLCRKWIIKRKIGEGEYGAILKTCCDPGYKKKKDCFVIKVQKKQNKDKTIEQEAEMQIMANKIIPGIAPKVFKTITYLSKTKNVGIIAMETISGDTLKNKIVDIIEKRSLSLDDKKEQSTRYLIRAIEIIKKLNSSQFIHGDCHLNNFMVTSSDVMKLIDFGESVVKPGTPITDYVKLYENFNVLADNANQDEDDGKVFKYLRDIVEKEIIKLLASNEKASPVSGEEKKEHEHLRQTPINFLSEDTAYVAEEDGKEWEGEKRRRMTSPSRRRSTRRTHKSYFEKKNTKNTSMRYKKP